MQNTSEMMLTKKVITILGKMFLIGHEVGPLQSKFLHMPLIATAPILDSSSPNVGS